MLYSLGDAALGSVAKSGMKMRRKKSGKEVNTKRRSADGGT